MFATDFTQTPSVQSMRLNFSASVSSLESKGSLQNALKLLHDQHCKAKATQKKRNMKYDWKPENQRNLFECIFYLPCWIEMLSTTVRKVKAKIFWLAIFLHFLITDHLTFQRLNEQCEFNSRQFIKGKKLKWFLWNCYRWFKLKSKGK